MRNYQELWRQLVDAEVLFSSQVEVGCLEEVLSRMAADQDGSWGSVMFIPKGEAAAEHPLRMPPCRGWFSSGQLAQHNH